MYLKYKGEEVFRASGIFKLLIILTIVCILALIPLGLIKLILLIIGSF